MKMSAVERFEAGYLPEPNTGCWLWIKAFQGDLRDRPCIAVNGKTIRAHRFSYENSFGKIPDRMLVCHRCDTPECVNPSHLFLGSSLDNRRDCTKKLRHSFGEKVYCSILTEDKVNEIRKLREGHTKFSRKNSISIEFLSKKYRVSKGAITGVLYRKTWKHLK